MNRLPMSSAGAALLRALLTRALVNRNRILLTDYRSTDWQSLTFVGERHELRFRVAGPDAQVIYERMTDKLDDTEFTIPRQIVADVVVYGQPSREPDGSIGFTIEALTIQEWLAKRTAEGCKRLVKFLRRIRLSLATCRMKVPIDPCLHFPRRVARLEQPDDAGIGFDGFEHILKDQLFLDLALGRWSGTQPLDEGDHVGLLKELGNGRQLERRLLKLGKRKRPAVRSELAQGQPDPAECGSTGGDRRHSELR